MNTTPAAPPETTMQAQTVADELRRPTEGRMLAGVAAGIARYIGVDVTIVRVALLVLAIVGGAGVPIYLAGWLLIPEEGAQQSIAAQLLQSWQNR
jgi:phage shock protein C